MQSDNSEKVEDYPKIPHKFAKHADEIKATVRETVSFKLKPATDSKPWQSKVGGIPYLPLGEEYPCNSKGVPLTFLMQVNFSEIPNLLGYPTEGIAGFYIDGTDDLIGLDSDNPTNNQDGFRVLYFQTIESDECKLQLNVTDSKNTYKDFSPFDKNCNMLMEFNLEKQFITPLDYRLNKYVSFGNNYDIIDEYREAFDTMGHRIGGYPHFKHADPRENFENFREYELLVQLDSDDKGILWGDMGVGAFFIHPNDLKDRNFSKVLYNWDCY